jgi:CheY-like chemotaxis protein
MPALPADLSGSVETLLPPAHGLFTHEPPPRLEPFDPDAPPDPARRNAARMVDQYTIRLGNPRYPFMKLVLGEHLIAGEYFLSVDTHEWMFQPELEDPAEADEIARLLAFNAELKGRIERRWNEARLPTLRDLETWLSSSQMCPVVMREEVILVVDDDHVAARALAALLASRGFPVDLAHDGEEALARADAARHRLVILDIDMPKKNGLVVCRTLKADPARASIPVLLSSQRPVGDRPPAGASSFLMKPFHADVLLYFIEVLLRSRSS